MSEINLFSKKVNFIIENNVILINLLEITYSELASPPNINDINVKLFDYNNLQFIDYGDVSGKFYTIENSSSTSCVIKFKSSKELASNSLILIHLEKELKNESVISIGSMFLSLEDEFNHGLIQNGVYITAPHDPGNYLLQLYQINEDNITSENIYSNIINVSNPIKNAEVPSPPFIDTRTSTSVSSLIINAKDKNNSLINADFITILRVKIV